MGSWLGSGYDELEDKVNDSTSGTGPTIGIPGVTPWIPNFNYNPLAPASQQGSDVSGMANAANDRNAELRGRINAAQIDPGTKRELLEMGADYDSVSREFQMAQAGEGKYAARKRYFDKLTISANRPGAIQLFGDSRGRANAQGGMLTAQPGAGLLTGAGYNR